MMNNHITFKLIKKIPNNYFLPTLYKHPDQKNFQEENIFAMLFTDFWFCFMFVN